MPRRNGTGPMGMGSMTGWGRGYCRVGRYPRQRMGYGYARGLRYPEPREYYYPSPEEEKTLLKNEKNNLKARLKEIDEILENFDEE